MNRAFVLLIVIALPALSHRSLQAESAVQPGQPVTKLQNIVTSSGSAASPGKSVRQVLYRPGKDVCSIGNLIYRPGLDKLEIKHPVYRPGIDRFGIRNLAAGYSTSLAPKACQRHGVCVDDAACGARTGGSALRGGRSQNSDVSSCLRGRGLPSAFPDPDRCTGFFPNKFHVVR